MVVVHTFIIIVIVLQIAAVYWLARLTAAREVS